MRVSVLGKAWQGLKGDSFRRESVHPGLLSGRDRCEKGLLPTVIGGKRRKRGCEEVLVFIAGIWREFCPWVCVIPSAVGGV